MNKYEMSNTLKLVFNLTDGEPLGDLLNRDDVANIVGFNELITLIGSQHISDKQAAIQCEKVIVAIRIKSNPTATEQAILEAFDQADHQPSGPGF